VKIDLSATDAGFAVLPAARYITKVTDGEVRSSGPNAKHPGSEYINWELTVQGGEYEGRKVFTNTPIGHGECDCSDWKAGAYIGIKSLLAATGNWDEAALASDDFDFEIDDVLGSDVKAVVSVSKYDGDDVNNVRKIRPLSDEDVAEASLLP